MAKRRRFHRERTARWYSRGKCYRVTVGRDLTDDGRLVDKDWYFPAHVGQEEADRLATQKAEQWEKLCTDWPNREEPFLRAFGEPFPDEPRWNRDPGATPTPEMLAAVREEHDRPLTDSQIAEYLADEPVSVLVRHYHEYRERTEVRKGTLKATSLAKITHQMTTACAELPQELTFRQIAVEHLDAAKEKLGETRDARTVGNYMGALIALLKFTHKKYGGGSSIPPAFVDAARVSKSKVSSSEYTTEQVKGFLRATRGTLSQLDLMLALNCGMGPQDIGRLQRDEIDLEEGSVFWDREKEPGNVFRVYHRLWPETLALVKRYLNDGSQGNRSVTDYRQGKPVVLNPSQLAFLDDGEIRYWHMPSGSEKNKVSEALRARAPGAKLKEMRKTASNWLEDVIEVGANPSLEHAVATQEIADRFLGHSTPTLRKIYRKFGKKAYMRMNAYLEQLGNELRQNGLFESVTE